MYFQNSALLPTCTQKKPRESYPYSVCLSWTQRGKECYSDVWNPIPQILVSYTLHTLLETWREEAALMKTHLPVYGQKIQALVSTMTSEEDSCGQDCVCSHSRKSDPEALPHHHALGVLDNVSKGHNFKEHSGAARGRVAR